MKKINTEWLKQNDASVYLIGYIKSLNQDRLDIICRELRRDERYFWLYWIIFKNLPEEIKISFLIGIVERISPILANRSATTPGISYFSKEDLDLVIRRMRKLYRMWMKKRDITNSLKRLKESVDYESMAPRKFGMKGFTICKTFEKFEEKNPEYEDITSKAHKTWLKMHVLSDIMLIIEKTADFIICKTSGEGERGLLPKDSSVISLFVSVINKIGRLGKLNISPRLYLDYFIIGYMNELLYGEWKED